MVDVLLMKAYLISFLMDLILMIAYLIAFIRQTFRESDDRRRW
jgi:hypothetical protein